MAQTLRLPTPTEFPAFPFDPPYEIQVQLMRHLYTSIEDKKVTIVESPTGTGKTLSLLCASLTWLSHEKDRAMKGKLDAIVGEAGDGKDWVIEQTRERARREAEADERDYNDRLKEARKRESKIRKMAKARVVKKLKLEQDVQKVVEGCKDNDDEFLPAIDSQGEGEEMNISPALQALMEKLSQILPELRRLKLNVQFNSHHHSGTRRATDEVASHSSQKRPADELGDDEIGDIAAPFSRTVSMASRKQLCINDKLRAKTRDLDEGCRELLSEKGDKRCPHLPPIGEETRMLDFRDQILASPKDIEDLAVAGRLSNICPYFGSRRAIPQAELVTLPYNLLLQKTAREALGIDLTDQIVIIDEAHNLIPTLLSLSTTRLPYSILSTSFQQVCVYVSKFRARLGAENMLHLKRLVVFLDALRKYALEWKTKAMSGEKVEVMNVAELMQRLGRKAGGVNLLEIEAYLRRSKIARKISGYSDREAEKNERNNIRRGAVPPLHAVETFLVSLSGTDDDGRVTLSLAGSPGQEEVEMKYQLLNPSPHFQDVVNAARSVILAGGTMSPVSDVTNQLFSYVDPERLSTFSCGHIIPSSNLQTLVVTKGPRGRELEYKAGKQGDAEVVAELGQILLNFLGIIPSGMIVFFPSYSFLNKVKVAWQASGYLDKFARKKKVLFEPEETTHVDIVLAEYAAAVQISAPSSEGKRGGALLLAVIGAKLSEGLNFADDLARAVIIVGLPFANLGSPELKERMNYVKRLEEQRASSNKKPGQKDAAAELYENMCMNAVNQSIGRAIRHRGDWASLILLDRRYTSPSIRGKLPKWIGDSITVTNGFGQSVKILETFYRSKRV